MGYTGFYILTAVLSFIGMAVSSRLKNKFNRYSQVGLRNRMSGKEIAETMLRHYGIHDVQVVMGQGFLSDHYNPRTKTVSLSPAVYEGRSVAAAAVAAHECGHAVQHDTEYSWLQFRSAIVPIVSIASSYQQYLLMIALMTTIPSLILVAIVAFLVTTIFSFVTLPVEFDASNRALAWLEEAGVTVGEEHDGAKDALWWAAMTYVSAALASLVSLIYLVLAYASRRD